MPRAGEVAVAADRLFARRDWAPPGLASADSSAGAGCPELST